MTRSKISSMKNTLLAVALVAATAGAANADDGGMGRFGDSYQYFANQPIITSPSTYRADHPNGQPLNWFQSNSAWGSAWQPAPLLTKAPSDPTIKQTHPSGLTEIELQAPSSPGPARHSAPAGQELASTSDTTVAQGVSH